MTQDNTLFSPVANGEVPSKTVDPTLPEGVKYRDLLVGEGKKFKDDEAIARGKWEADMYIKRLEAEKEEMRRDLEARMSVDEFIKQMKKEKLSPPSNQAPQMPEGERRNEQPQITPSMTAEEIQRLVEDKMSKKDEEKLRRENVLFARNELAKQWGQTFPERLKAEAARLGVSEDFLTSTAEKAPQAFLKLLGINPEGPSKASTYQAPNKSELHVVVGNVEDGVERKWQDYEALRKKDPRRYWSRQIQSEIHKLAALRGSSFLTK